MHEKKVTATQRERIKVENITRGSSYIQLTTILHTTQSVIKNKNNERKGTKFFSLFSLFLYNIYTHRIKLMPWCTLCMAVQRTQAHTHQSSESVHTHSVCPESSTHEMLTYVIKEESSKEEYLNNAWHKIRFFILFSLSLVFFSFLAFIPRFYFLFSLVFFFFLFISFCSTFVFFSILGKWMLVGFCLSLRGFSGIFDTVAMAGLS